MNPRASKALTLSVGLLVSLASALLFRRSCQLGAFGFWGSIVLYAMGWMTTFWALHSRNAYVSILIFISIVVIALMGAALVFAQTFRACFVF